MISGMKTRKAARIPATAEHQSGRGSRRPYHPDSGQDNRKPETERVVTDQEYEVLDQVEQRRVGQHLVTGKGDVGNGRKRLVFDRSPFGSVKGKKRGGDKPDDGAKPDGHQDGTRSSGTPARTQPADLP